MSEHAAGAPSYKKSPEEVYAKILLDRETDYREAYEDSLRISLMSKPSMKWMLNGFIEAQIHHESRGNQTAISPKGAIGKCQFMPSTWEALITRGLLPEWFVIDNEEHQEIAQLIYLDYLYTMWYNEGDDRKALTVASYNAGPGAIKNIKNQYGSLWRENLPAETSKYLINLKRFI